MEEEGVILSKFGKSLEKLMNSHKDKTLSGMINKLSGERVEFDEAGQFDWTIQGQQPRKKFKPRSKEFMKR